MQLLNFNYSPTLLQRLFIEKGLELLYKDTIDTYRLRLHNPKTIIEELYRVCKEAKAGVLTNNIYANSSAKEALSLLRNNNHGLEFNSIASDYFIRLLENSKSENYNQIIQACNLVLRDNINFQNKLFELIKQKIDTYVPGTILSSDEIKKFVLLIDYLCVELVNLGFTKQYLYHFFRTIFVHATGASLSFDERFLILKELGTRRKENFKVIYHIQGISFQYQTLKRIDKRYEQLTKKFKHTLPASTSPRVFDFLDENKGRLVAIKVQSLDHFKAVELSRAKLSNDLDIYHLGFNDQLITIGPKAVVVGTKDPSKASTLPSNYQIDGYIRSSKEVFESLLKKFNKLKRNNVEEESIDKILSAIRYLRTGSESPELETKLLNYWIGLEYIFTSFNTDEKPIERMRHYLPVCHAVIYPKRNLFGFHKSLERVGMTSFIPTWNSSLHYLTRPNTYTLQIIPNTSNELLKFRSEFYKSWAENPGNIDKAITKHIQNLEWNITRLYRIRNAIVHNAAVTNSIYANVSHIKYYLTFILNSLLEYLSEIPIDVNSDGKISIDDYFITQDIILGSLKGKPIREYVKVNNPMEILH
jgi:hypothetical protein